MQSSLQFGPSLDEQVRDVLDGKGPWRLDWEGIVILRALSSHRGAGRPIPLRDLAAETKLDAREVKALVRSLVIDFGLPIGASRAEPSGYFLAETAAERLAAARPYIHEIRNLAVRVRALVGTHEFTELLGQGKLFTAEGAESAEKN